jgi:hypothetical protein
MCGGRLRMRTHPVALRIAGVLFAIAALGVFVVGGVSTIFCFPQDVTGCSEGVAFSLLTIGGVLILGAAAVASFRWAHSPSRAARAIVLGVVATLILGGGIFLIAQLVSEPSPPPMLPNPTLSSSTTSATV